MNTTVVTRLPETTYNLIKEFICEREEGVFQKGMIMDLINKATIRYIAEQRSMRMPIGDESEVCIRK